MLPKIFVTALVRLFFILRVVDAGLVAGGYEERWDRTALFCPAKLPDGFYGPPNGREDGRRWSAANFSVGTRIDLQFIGLRNLCAATGNHNGNLGGVCDDAGRLAGWGSSRLIHWNYGFAERVGLYDARIAVHCENYCTCATSYDEYLHLQFTEAMARHGYGRDLPNALGSQPDALRSMWEWDIPDIAHTRPRPAGFRWPWGTRRPSADSRGQCSTRCEGYRCTGSSNQANKCACKAVQLSKGVFAPGGCAAQARMGPWGGKRKRNVGSFPCPCNSSYVSVGCCGSDDGLVWESPQARLGKMVNQDHHDTTG